jgi:hypothetical protein
VAFFVFFCVVDEKNEKVRSKSEFILFLLRVRTHDENILQKAKNRNKHKKKEFHWWIAFFTFFVRDPKLENKYLLAEFRQNRFFIGGLRFYGWISFFHTGPKLEKIFSFRSNSHENCFSLVD